MQKYIQLITQPSTYKELESKISAKTVLAVYVLVLFLSIIPQLFINSESSFGIFGFLIALVSGIFGLFFGLAISLSFYALLALGSSLIIQGKTKADFKDVFKIYIFSLVPQILLSLITSIILIFMLPFIWLLNIGPLVLALIGFITIISSIIGVVWTFVVLVNAIKSKYQTTLTNAILAGCVPYFSIIVFLVFCAIIFLLLFAIIGISLF